MPTEKLLFDYSTPKTLRLKLSGDWHIASGLPDTDEVTAQMAVHAGLKQIVFDVSADMKWDSAFVAFLLRLDEACRIRKISMSRQGLPQDVMKIFDSAYSAMTSAMVPHKPERGEFFEMVGKGITHFYAETLSLLEFIGEITLAFGRLARGKISFRRGDFFYIIQRSGVDALGLVSLISIMVGIIFAFVGAIQLQTFGAQIFVAHIVGIAMVRVMGAVMAGILMAGRTGASFAAELGIMQTNEEIDALKTLGINPVDFLVVPRVLALIIMLPLLTLYADIMGILGGLLICATMLGINPLEYWQHTQMAVKLSNLWVGLVNSLAFGVIVAVAGCFYGIKCERSAAGVGQATTAAVVSAITWIVIATTLITFICQILGIN